MLRIYTIYEIEKMKKIVNVITLIVMVSVNVMTPFTYADSLWDNFDEIQNLDEVMQENGDFDDEENIENDDTEDNESDLQEDDEDIENDENSGEEDNEEDEDNEEENTDEIDEDSEEQDGEDDENIENEENSEEQYEENIEEENEEDTDEQDEDDSNSAIDLLKDIIEGSWNILSWEMLDFTWDSLELTWEIIELTWEALELSIARETLNTNPIIWTENTKWVTVNVEAQAWTFPEWTELRIKPITLNKELNEIKEQIIDSQKNVSEDSELVAFDISFIYTLSGWDGVEVQPKNGEWVKVTFDYTDNQTLSEADNNDEQEIKVFHIEEVTDEEWNKTWERCLTRQ